MEMVLFESLIWHWSLVILHGLGTLGLLRAAYSGWQWYRSHSLHLNSRFPIKGILYSWTFLLITGAMLYPEFRVRKRAAWMDDQLPWITGLFEIKEHLAALGFAFLVALYFARHSTELPNLATGRWGKTSYILFMGLFLYCSVVGLLVLGFDLQEQIWVK